jgi:hypothetical protein
MYAIEISLGGSSRCPTFLLIKQTSKRKLYKKGNEAIDLQSQLFLAGTFDVQNVLHVSTCFIKA